MWLEILSEVGSSGLLPACLEGGGGGEEGVNPTSPPFHNIPSTSIHRTVDNFPKHFLCGCGVAWLSKGAAWLSW
jgi:hypothetical protein